jgi:hypothetical protein
MVVSCRAFSLARWLLIILFCLGSTEAGAADPAKEAQWAELNTAVADAYNRVDYGRGVVLADEAWRVAKEAFGGHRQVGGGPGCLTGAGGV